MEITQEIKKEEKPKPEVSMRIFCECGENYRVAEGEYIICPNCKRPPLLLWSFDKKLHKFGGICERVENVGR